MCMSNLGIQLETTDLREKSEFWEHFSTIAILRLISSDREKINLLKTLENPPTRHLGIKGRRIKFCNINLKIITKIQQLLRFIENSSFTINRNAFKKHRYQKFGASLTLGRIDKNLNEMHWYKTRHLPDILSKNFPHTLKEVEKINFLQTNHFGSTEQI